MLPNNAIIPVPNTQKDFYDWDQRREIIKNQTLTGSHDLIFIGDSITHLFEVAGRGAEIWKEYFGGYRTLNLGYGWDCTQNVLWRLKNGELRNQFPRLVVLTIGTNNLTGNSGGRSNTPDEIVEGIEAICDLIHVHSPSTMILAMGLFPRGKTDHEIYGQVKEINVSLKTHLAGKAGVMCLDISRDFLMADGEISQEVMDDGVHLTERGYSIWAKAISGIVGSHLGPSESD